MAIPTSLLCEGRLIHRLILWDRTFVPVVLMGQGREEVVKDVKTTPWREQI